MRDAQPLYGEITLALLALTNAGQQFRSFTVANPLGSDMAGTEMENLPYISGCAAMKPIAETRVCSRRILEGGVTPGWIFWRQSLSLDEGGSRLVGSRRPRSPRHHRLQAINDSCGGIAPGAAVQNLPQQIPTTNRTKGWPRAN
jgi:hypothetical protein